MNQKPYRAALALSRVLALLVGLGLAPATQAESYLGKRVQLELDEGQTIDGVVETEEEDRILIKREFGQIWIKRERIKKIEILKPPREAYGDKQAACKTASDWVELAKWCRRGDIGLEAEAKKCLDKAVEIDPEHKEARNLRGDLKVAGKWYDEEAGNKLLGRKKWKNKWVTEKEYEELEKREKLKNNKAVKNLLDQYEERKGRPWGEVKPIETANYLTKSNSTEKMAQHYAMLMEDLYDAYDSLFKESEFPRHGSGKGRVYIFRNHDEFMDFTLQGPGIGGFFSHIDRSVRAYHGSFGVTGSTEMVLAHEATHQFQDRIIKNMRSAPTWLIEGMAVYYGDGTKFGRGVQLHQIPRDRLHSLKDAIRTGRYTKLQQLLRIPHAFFHGGFYDHGWGVIYWCLQGEKYKAHKGEGRRVWDRYLKHVCNELPDPETAPPNHLDLEGKVFEGLLLQETGYKSIEEWEKQYTEFISKLPLEALGQWKGQDWDGSKQVGIQVAFPKAPAELKLVKVDELDLRTDYHEAAAMRSSSQDLRLWVGVDANWMELTALDESESLANGMIQGFFNEVKFSSPPKAAKFQNLDDLALVEAKFQGRFKKRQEVNTMQGAGPKDKGGEKGKGTGGDKGKPGGAGKDAKAAATALDTKKTYHFKVAFVITPDKVYSLCMAGDDAPFARAESLVFDDFVKSVRLTFGSSAKKK